MPVGSSQGQTYDDAFDFAVQTAHQNAEADKTEQQGISGFFSKIFGGGEAEAKPTPVIKGDPDPGYPTNEDADFAKKHGFAYGQEWENFFNGSAARVMGYDFTPKDKKGKPVTSQTAFVPLSGEGLSPRDATIGNSKVLDLNDPKFLDIKEKLKNNYAKAALAVNRDPIASLGFSPDRVTVDSILGSKGNLATIAGAYSKDTDQIYSNLSSHSNIVHESIHRGLEQLFRRSPEAVEEFNKMKINEEYIVRHLMTKTMGNPELGLGDIGDKQIKTANYLFNDSSFAKDLQAGLKKLQYIAVQEIAKKHPGGPR